jgi:pimeloyl-ACP methyl ester carboxylesterase
MQTGQRRTLDGRATLHYALWGDGELPLVYLPGGGDGLHRPGHSTAPIAWWLRRKSSEFRILYISRRDPIPRGFSLDALADDVIELIGALGWGSTMLEAQSAGGPVGQLVAARCPELVHGLVLTSTTAHLSASARRKIERWRQMLEHGEMAEFLRESNRAIWSPRMHGIMRPFMSLLGASMRLVPRERMLGILDGLLELDHRALLGEIEQPALVIGGAQDRVFPVRLQREMAEALPNARLEVFEEQGHGLDFEHASSYEREVLSFCREIWEEVATDAA